MIADLKKKKIVIGMMIVLITIMVIKIIMLIIMTLITNPVDADDELDLDNQLHKDNPDGDHFFSDEYNHHVHHTDLDKGNPDHDHQPHFDKDNHDDDHDFNEYNHDDDHPDLDKDIMMMMMIRARPTYGKSNGLG